MHTQHASVLDARFRIMTLESITPQWIVHFPIVAVTGRGCCCCCCCCFSLNPFEMPTKFECGFFGFAIWWCSRWVRCSLITGISKSCLTQFHRQILDINVWVRFWDFSFVVDWLLRNRMKMMNQIMRYTSHTNRCMVNAIFDGTFKIVNSIVWRLEVEARKWCDSISQFMASHRFSLAVPNECAIIMASNRTNGRKEQENRCDNFSVWFDASIKLKTEFLTWIVSMFVWKSCMCSSFVCSFTKSLRYTARWHFLLSHFLLCARC